MTAPTPEADAFVAITSDGPIVGTVRGSGPALLFLHGGPAISPGPHAATFASVAEHLAAGFADKLPDLRVPAVFLLGASSPMPTSQGEQTAALLPASEVRIIADAGHLPWHEQPGCLRAALGRVRELVTGDD